MKYSVKADGSNVEIIVTEVGAKQAALLTELNECVEGRCSCPTPQYAKVQDLQIAPGADHVVLKLTAKLGESIDQGDILKCLDQTTRKVEQQS